MYRYCQLLKISRVNLNRHGANLPRVMVESLCVC